MFVVDVSPLFKLNLNIINKLQCSVCNAMQMLKPRRVTVLLPELFCVVCQIQRAIHAANTTIPQNISVLFVHNTEV